MQTIDVAVIGAGPAGLTAGIYLGRARLKAIIFEKALSGGQMVISEWIENFPGFPEGIGGLELSKKMREQAEKSGAVFIDEEVIQLKKENAGFLLKTSESKEYKASSVIIATGAVPKRMGIPGEAEFTGKGVSYCATCDAPLFKAKTVVVIGGGDTAVQEALFLAKYAKLVYLVHRRDRLRAVKILAERLSLCEKVKPVWNSIVTEIKGDKRVKAAVINNVGAGPCACPSQGGHRGSPLQIACDGVFIFAGVTPISGIVKGVVDMDEKGSIFTDDNMKSSCEGIFVCGDVRKKALWQIVTACGEAATASVSAQHYVEGLKGSAY